MKIYGYPKHSNLTEPYELGDVTIVANPEVLRQLATFITECADGIEASRANEWEHEHFKDANTTVPKTYPDIVVYNPSAIS